MSVETEFDRDRVLNRVKKMLALANDAAAAEGERDNALRMAYNTLAKYNLTMGEVDAAGNSRDDDQRTEGSIEGNDWPWSRTVAMAVAELFFCKYFFMRSGDKRVKHYFVGKTANILTAQEMSKYVERSIYAESLKHGKDTGGSVRDFAKGAAHRVYYRCKDLRRAAEAESQIQAGASTGTSLVLASVYARELSANLAFLAAKGMKLKSSSNRERTSDGSSYGAGERYGNTVSLNRQVGDGRVKGRLTS